MLHVGNFSIGPAKRASRSGSGSKAEGLGPGAMSGVTGRPPAYTRAQHSLETYSFPGGLENCSPGTRLRVALQRLTLTVYVLLFVYHPVLDKISRDFRLFSWKSPGLQVTQVGRSARRSCTADLSP